MKKSFQSFFLRFWTLFTFYNFYLFYLLSKLIIKVFGTDAIAYGLYRTIGKKNIATIEDYRLKILTPQVNRFVAVDTLRVMSYLPFLFVGIIVFFIIILVFFLVITLGIEAFLFSIQPNLILSVCLYFSMFH